MLTQRVASEDQIIGLEFFGSGAAQLLGAPLTGSKSAIGARSPR